MFGGSSYGSNSYGGLSALVVTTNDKTFTTDAIVVDRFEITITTDGLVILVNEKTFTNDGIVQGTTEQIITTDGIVAERIDKTFNTDGIVFAIIDFTFTTDGVISPNETPDITFRRADDPSQLLTSINYIQRTPSGSTLPVLKDEKSDSVLFRIYNNWALNPHIATAMNVLLTVFDGVVTPSHTCTLTPVSQSWVHILQTGFGEAASQPGLFTQFIGTDTDIGGCPPGTNTYSFEKSSNGVFGVSKIRAYSTSNGLGFIELKTYVDTPENAFGASYNFALSISFDWVS